MVARVIELAKGNRKVLALAVLLAAAVAADAAFYAAVFRPASGEASRLEARLAELEKLNGKAGGDMRRYELFIEGRKSLDEFKAMLASRSEYTEVLRKVYDLAQKDGMRSKSFGTQKSTLPQVGGLEQLSFVMPVSGGYRNVRKFIYDIETSDLFLNIDNLGLVAGEGGGDVSLQIGISTYVRS